MKTVFLFGHREVPHRTWMMVYDAAMEMINATGDGKLCFIVGHRGAFDESASGGLAILKLKYPQIILLRLIAYYDPFRKEYLLDEFDGTYYPEGLETVPKPFAIVKANQIMVDSCDAVICFVQREGSNTYKLLRRAQRRGIPVVNLAEWDLEEYNFHPGSC